MTRTLHFFCCIGLLAHFGLYAQSPAHTDNPVLDSLQQVLEQQEGLERAYTYREIFLNMRAYDIQTAKAYLDSAAAINALVQNDTLKARLYESSARYHYYISDYKEGAAQLQLAIEVNREIGNRQDLPVNYNALGIFYKYLGKPGLALESFQNALRTSEQLGQPSSALAPALMNIGKLHAELGDLEISNTYYRRVEAICGESGVEYCLAITRSNMATNLAEAGNYREALQLYQEALPYFESENLKTELGEQYNLMASVYLKMDSLNTARTYLENALEINRETGELRELGMAHRGLGDIHFREGDYRLALERYQTGLGYFEPSNSLDAVETYLRISESFDKLGNIPQAYAFHTRFFSAYDSIFSQKNQDKISALEIQYESEKNRQEIQMQQQEIALLQEKQKADRLQRIGLISGLVVVLFFAGLGYYALRQKMKRNRLERERVKAELAFKKKELTTHALHLAKKNEILEDLKQQAKSLKETEDNSTAYKALLRTISADQQDDKAWENFTQYFEAVHKDFARKATEKYPEITRTELRLMALIKMNLSSKEIASILNISAEGVKKARHRLRKKMELSRADSLDTAIMSL